MQKIILGLFILFLTIGSLNADNTKAMSDDDFMKQFMQQKQRQKNADKRIVKAKEATKTEKAKTKDILKYAKTVNELAKTVKVDK